jgi:hypothetical protein
MRFVSVRVRLSLRKLLHRIGDPSGGLRYIVQDEQVRSLAMLDGVGVALIVTELHEPGLHRRVLYGSAYLAASPVRTIHRVYHYAPVLSADGRVKPPMGSPGVSGN